MPPDNNPKTRKNDPMHPFSLLFSRMHGDVPYQSQHICSHYKYFRTPLVAITDTLETPCRHYRRFSNPSGSTSYPGLPGNTNMFFAAPRSCLVNGFTPSKHPLTPHAMAGSVIVPDLEIMEMEKSRSPATSIESVIYLSLMLLPT